MLDSNFFNAGFSNHVASAINVSATAILRQRIKYAKNSLFQTPVYILNQIIYYENEKENNGLLFWLTPIFINEVGQNQDDRLV